MGADPITGKYLLGKVDTRKFANLTNNAEVAGKKTQFQCRGSSAGGRQRRSTRSMAKGLVEEVFPDTEGTVRRVTVRTANGTYQRDVRKICLLEGNVLGQ